MCLKNTKEVRDWGTGQGQVRSMDALPWAGTARGWHEGCHPHPRAPGRRVITVRPSEPFFVQHSGQPASMGQSWHGSWNLPLSVWSVPSLGVSSPSEAGRGERE